MDQAEVGHCDAALARRLVVVILLRADIFRVVGVAKLHQPVAPLVREHRFGACAAAVAAVIQKEAGIVVLLLPEHLQGFSLQQIEVLQLLSPLYDGGGLEGERAHASGPDETQTVERRQLGVVDAFLQQYFVEQIASVAVGQAVLEDAEVAVVRGGLRQIQAGLQRQFQRRDAEAFGQPRGGVFEGAQLVVGRQRECPHSPVVILHGEQVCLLHALCAFFLLLFLRICVSSSIVEYLGWAKSDLTSEV